MNNNEPENLTQKEAATAYARAWNRLDCTDFLKLLAEDAHYSSQMVLNELKNKQEISEYLTGKMETIKGYGDYVKAELAVVQSPLSEQIGVYMTRGVIEGFKAEEAVVLFEVSEDKITRVNMCMPGLFGGRLTGEVPE